MYGLAGGVGGVGWVVRLVAVKKKTTVAAKKGKQLNASKNRKDDEPVENTSQKKGKAKKNYEKVSDT